MGWFPKTYVEYVDVEAEKKRLQEGEGVRGACVIVGGCEAPYGGEWW